MHSQGSTVSHVDAGSHGQTLAVRSSEGQACPVDLERRPHKRQDGIKARIGCTGGCCHKAGQRPGAWSRVQSLQVQCSEARGKDGANESQACCFRALPASWVLPPSPRDGWGGARAPQTSQQQAHLDA